MTGDEEGESAGKFVLLEKDNTGAVKKSRPADAGARWLSGYGSFDLGSKDVNNAKDGGSRNSIPYIIYGPQPPERNGSDPA